MPTTGLNKLVQNSFWSSSSLFPLTENIIIKRHTPPRPRFFYLLPKIHKPPTDWPIPGKCPLGRPIISDCGSESYGSAEYLDHFRKTQELYQGHKLLHWKSEIPNTNTWIVFSVFHGCRRSLHKHRHTRAWQTLQNNPDEKRPDEHILDLLHMNLTCNDFVFNQKTYLHIKGTAMGKRFSLAYVNTPMAEWEESAFLKCSRLPLIYLRYCIWMISGVSGPTLPRTLRDLSKP